MPALREDIDRHAVAAQIALMGIRPTARATGLPVGTVQDIAEQMNVTLPAKPMRLVPIETKRAPVRSLQDESLQPSLRPAHAVITDARTEAGRAASLHVALRGAVVLESAYQRALDDPERALAESADVLSTAKGLQVANVPGFEREQAASAQAVVNIALLGIAPSQVVQDQGQSSQ